MSRISVDSFIGGLALLYQEKLTFKNGHDGSDGSCDGIGFIRGGLIRGGATKIVNMKEINQFARKTALNIRKNDGYVSKGDILLKVKDMNDDSMPLPSKYRIGGNEYTNDTNNYVDISVVVNTNPVEIYHMMKDGIKKESNLSEWDYVCKLPYVAERKTEMSSAMVFTENGDSVKLYAQPSFSCNEVINLPNESIVMVSEKNDRWATVLFGDKNGYVLSKFIKPVESKGSINGVDMKEIEKAYLILGKVLGYIK